MIAGARLRGRFEAVCRDAQGNIKWREDVSNGVTTEGCNYLLDTGFHGGTAASTWYIGLIDSDGYTGLDAGDTLASHDGWSEATPYSGNRPEWAEGAASNGSMTNASAVSIEFNGSATLKGAFLASANTGTSGTLYSTALFSTTRSVVSGDTLNLTYTVSIADSEAE